MCGIFIVINKTSEELNINKCKKILKGMHHRGPDWSLYKILNKNIFVGQVVLSMTGKLQKDIEQHYSISKNYFIVFNGEIYNYKNLSSEYLNQEVDKNISDTKILVSLFDFKNIKQINSLLDGPYAYVVYDKQKNQLILGKDPLGEKFLYICENEKRIIISSEINPIIQFTKDNQINIDTLKTYFYTRHFTQFKKTIFKNIKILEPGTLSILSLNNFKFKTLAINSVLSYINEKEFNKNLRRKEEDLVDEIDFLFKKNIKEMIPKNRKFASTVSGGIDSALVSNYICKISKPEELISLNHVGKDEIVDQNKKFGKYFNKNISQYKIYKEDYYKNLIIALNICNSPISSHSSVGTLMTSEKINKNGCRAIFGGEGADELFGGFETYKQNIIDLNINNSDYTKLFKPNIFSTNNKEFKYFKETMNINWKKCLKSYSFLESKDQQYRLAMMLMDFTIQLRSNALKSCDLMSMYYSVEPRCIFLRKDIVKFALNLPLKFKINMKQNNVMSTKVLLKKVFLKYFPNKLIVKKQGFAGFPNEMVSFLGPFKNYIIKDLLKISNFDSLINQADRATAWKIYNTEMYLKTVSNLNNFK